MGGTLYAAVKIARGGTNTSPRVDPGRLGLAFRDVVYGDGSAAWYVPGEPGRPVIVVVHGYGGNRADAIEVGPPLRARGWGLLFVELGYVGGGRSYGGGQREADEVAAAVSWVRGELHVPAVLLGFSAGGFASLAAVAGGADVAALVSDSGFGTFREVVAFRAHLPVALTALLPVLYPLASGGGHAVDVARRLGDRRFPVPTLVIQGGGDRTIAPSSGRRLARLTGGTLWLLPGVAHTKAFHADEVEWVARVDAFLRAATTG